MRAFIAFLIVVSFYLSGCTVVAVADAAASATVGVAKGTAKAAGTTVDVLIPDGDDG